MGYRAATTVRPQKAGALETLEPIIALPPVRGTGVPFGAALAPAPNRRVREKQKKGRA